MLITSISGIRGTIGGHQGEGLNPPDVVRFATGYARWIREQSGADRPKVVIGRDARLSGSIVRNCLVGTLNAMGVDVLDLGLSTTPTVELAVPAEKADGGIILTASHNPKQWNALKLLNRDGEFLSAADGEVVLEYANQEAAYSEIDAIGEVTEMVGWMQRHVQLALELELVDAGSVRERKFKIAVDAVNSTGGIIMPMLLEALGCEVVPVNCEPTGHFAHNPEPLPAHLEELCSAVIEHGCDLGISVDPDVDRLAFVCEDGSWFGEEYTLVAVADYVLSKNPGNAVSNMSSTRALKQITEKHGGTYTASAVGEVNVVDAIKKTNAIIGGEGNGGIIYPASHHGRDAVVGTALFLTHLAHKNCSVSELRSELPNWFMAKDKLELPDVDVDAALRALVLAHEQAEVNTLDGVKFDLPEGWVHLRKSNTEPIIRVYSEAESLAAAEELAKSYKAELTALLNALVI
ncbi:MAG: phosphoglucosamine mutase [Bacteroidetes bacterium]|nr:phosphoglucosamine mutase [Bacteroidota bacterium]MDA1335314.1 phosphoglucosamine mutase [Bacteroidota bacterium]